MRRLVAILALAAVAGCGGEDEATPEDRVRAAVQSYLGALAGDRPEEACAQLTRDAQRAMSDEVSAAFSNTGPLSCPEAASEMSVDLPPEDRPILEEAVVESVRIEGDRATAEVLRLAEPVPLVRIGDEWRVDRSGYEIER